MKKLRIAIVTFALVGAASLAVAQWTPPAPTCCACLEHLLPPAQTSQLNRTALDALFCASVSEGNTTALEERCQAATYGDGGLECTDDSSNSTCAQDLAQVGIVCPSAGVPAAGPLNLATLAVVLSAAGAVLLRRRSRRDA